MTEFILEGKIITHEMKKGIKIIGIACASFNRITDKEVPVIGAIYRGAELLEGVVKTTVAVDGEDGTEKIAEMICNSSHLKQLKLIITRGLTIAGFNYIDLEKLFELTQLPVISVVDRLPDMDEIANALTNLPNGEMRLTILQKYLPLLTCETSSNEEPVYIQMIGIETRQANKLLREITITGRIPEPIRAARLIALAL
ncbi:MAG: DUF99 family protein [Candidatus Heimdallarchaeota archaeon]|nr:DUF99 family protein [Candidatus Heimdallarchaeota archaeon]